MRTADIGGVDGRAARAAAAIDIHAHVAHIRHRLRSFPPARPRSRCWCEYGPGFQFLVRRPRGGRRFRTRRLNTPAPRISNLISLKPPTPVFAWSKATLIFHPRRAAYTLHCVKIGHEQASFVAAVRTRISTITFLSSRTSLGSSRRSSASICVMLAASEFGFFLRHCEQFGVGLQLCARPPVRPASGDSSDTPRRCRSRADRSLLYSAILAGTAFTPGSRISCSSSSWRALCCRPVCRASSWGLRGWGWLERIIRRAGAANRGSMKRQMRPQRLL